MNDLKWCEHLYTDERAKKKIKQIQWMLNHGAGSFRVYLVTLSTSEGMQLDILHAAQLKQPALRERLPMIVGVAYSYDAAQELVIQMVEDALCTTGSADLKKYFEQLSAEKGADECYI